MKLILLLFLIFVSNMIIVDALLCYQETANESTICGNAELGVYSNKTTYPHVYINYSKPPSATNNTLWRVIQKCFTSMSDKNYTIPTSCHEYGDTINVRTSGSASASDYYCQNSTGWQLLEHRHCGNSKCGTTNCGDTEITAYIDGNPNTWIRKSEDCASWSTNSEGGGDGCDSTVELYEEAIWWDLNGAYHKYTTPTIVSLGDNVTYNLNITSGINVTHVNFSLSNDTGVTYYFSDVNGVQNGTIYTSQSVLINVVGIYTYYFTILDKYGDVQTGNYSFEITDINTITPSSVIQVKQGGQTINFSIVLSSNNADNIAWNITYDDGLGENFTVQGNTTDKIGNFSHEINITIASGTPNAVYNGSINITRDLDDYTFQINLTITIATTYGNIYLENPSDWGETIYDDETTSTEFIFNNTGNGNLTGCNLSLGSGFIGKSFYSFNESNFNLTGNETINVSLSFTNAPASTYVGDLQCTCSATTTGEIDTLDALNQPIISLTSVARPVDTTQTGGSSGWKEGTCDLTLSRPRPGSSVTLIGSVNKYSKPAQFTIKNTGASMGHYLYTVLDNDYLKENCEFEFLSSSVDANLEFTNSITCYIDEETQTGTISISGCGKTQNYVLKVYQSRLLAFFSSFIRGDKIDVFGYQMNAILFTLIMAVVIFIGGAVIYLLALLAFKKAYLLKRKLPG